MGLVAIRLVGAWASRHVRFSQFVSPRGNSCLSARHNPAGAVMVLALLATRSCVAVTGFLKDAPGRLAMVPAILAILAPAWADEAGAHREYGAQAKAMSETLQEAHELFANLLLLPVLRHVGGIVLASVRHHENRATLSPAEPFLTAT